MNNNNNNEEYLTLLDMPNLPNTVKEPQNTEDIRIDHYISYDNQATNKLLFVCLIEMKYLAKGRMPSVPGCFLCVC